MVCVENIYTHKKEKLVKENVLMNIAHALWEVANFKTFHSLWARLVNLIETRRVYYFSTDSTAVGSSCFASEAYHSRSALSDSTDRNRSGHISCQSESVLKRKCQICKCVTQDCCKWSTLHFHRQVAWNRVGWKSDYDEWSWLLFEKSDCKITTSVNVKLAWWCHWKALTANEFRRLFREGPWGRAEKRLGVQASWVHELGLFYGNNNKKMIARKIHVPILKTTAGVDCVCWDGWPWLTRYRGNLFN